MAAILIPPGHAFEDANHNAVAGGKIYFYDTNTTTLKDVYSDPELTTVIANPYTLDSAGRLDVVTYVQDSARYTWVVQDANNASVSGLTRNDVWGVSENVANVAEVTAYGASGDGTTDDTAAITAAVAAGIPLYWPTGTYLTTTSIPGLHNVRHSGPGVLKRGTNEYRWEPDIDQVNKIYIDPLGANTNDGMSAGEPFQTCQAALEAIQDNQGGIIPGQLEFHLAAGTYTLGFNFDGEVRSQQPIYIYGPTQGHPNVPTAIIDGTTDATGTGLYVRGSTRVICTDVKFENYSTGTAVINNSGKVNLTNVHTDNCRVGVSALHGALTTISGGDYDGNSIASSVGYQSFYNSTHSIEGTSISNSPKFHHFARGLLINEGAQGHLDYTIVEDCTTAGVNIKRGAGACNMDSMQIHRNAIGVLVENNAWFDNGIDYGIGTANVNTVNVKLIGSSPELGYTASSNESTTQRTIERSNVAAHTGTTSATTVYTSAALPDWGVNQGGNHTSKLRAYGVATLTGNVTLQCYIDNGSARQQIGSIAVTSGVTDFTLDMDVSYVSAAGQRGVLRITGNGGYAEVDYEAGTIDLEDTDHTLEIDATLANSGDSITFSIVRLETSLGG